MTLTFSFLSGLALSFVSLMKIKHTHILLLVLVASGLASCQKEVDYVDLGNTGNPTSPTQSITGDWKFVRMVLDMEMTDKSDDGFLKLEATIKGGFVSFNEKGTLKIESDKMTGNGIAYSVDTVYKLTASTNGVQDMDMEIPWKYDMPASNGSSTFKRITADSLALTSTFMSPDLPPTSGQAVQPTGMRTSFSGDTLLLTTRVNQTVDGNDGSKTTFHLKQVVKLLKN
ncbi:MAG: hypothetical protein DI535_25040 [Citrobacter freundii]|nr:MAG: hypothetical protein DI535_25040 [Citrobacter freundii]